MEPEAAGVRAALPGTLRERWDHIATIDARIGTALADDDLAVLHELAPERTDAIASFADEFPLDPHRAGLRIAALRHLLSMNEELMSRARLALAATVSSSVTARHQRHAISAYHENPPEA